jgi:hypothetical protein
MRRTPVTMVGFPVRNASAVVPEPRAVLGVQLKYKEGKREPLKKEVPRWQPKSGGRIYLYWAKDKEPCVGPRGQC